MCLLGYSAPPDPLAGFKGPTSKGREGGGKGRGWDKGSRREGIAVEKNSYFKAWYDVIIQREQRQYTC